MFSSYDHGARCEGGEVKRERERKKKSSSETQRKTSKQRWGQSAVERKDILGAPEVGKG